MIRDIDSRNGTFYRGQRIGELTLSLGSRITVGETELELIADREDFEGTQGDIPGPLRTAVWQLRSHEATIHTDETS